MSHEIIVDREGPKGIFGVFEDDGETGYLYIYKPEEGIQRHLHIYDRVPELNICAEDVRVSWSRDFSKCGVVIWGKMRGIIDLKKGVEGRVWLDSPNSPGIDDPNWLSGFDL